MLSILDLPNELFHAILVQAVLVRGTKRGLRLRLVSKRFASDVKQALFVSGLLEDMKCRDTNLLQSYFVYKILAGKIDASSPLGVVCRTAEILCKEMGRTREDEFRACVEDLCFLTITQGRNRTCERANIGQNGHHDLNKHLLPAAAYINCTSLVEQLLATEPKKLEWSSLFGHPAKVAAFQGNNDILEQILASDSSYHTRCMTAAGAITGGHFHTLNFLMDPRWNLKTGTILSRAIWSALEKVGNVAMFIRAFDIAAPHDTEPLKRRLGNSLTRAAANRNLDIATYLFSLGVDVSGYESETYGDENPLWNAARYGDESMVQLLLKKGADPNSDPDVFAPTSLQTAAARGHLEIVRTLLDYGAKVDGKSKGQIIPPVIFAVKLEYLAMFHLLKERGAILSVPRTSRLAFNEAAAEGLESMVRLLLQEGLGPTTESVEIAMKHGHHNVARILRKHVTDITIEIAGLWG